MAYSGEPGAFAEDAVRAYFGEAVAAIPVPGFRAVFEAVAAASPASEGLAAGSGRKIEAAAVTPPSAVQAIDREAQVDARGSARVEAEVDARVGAPVVASVDGRGVAQVAAEADVDGRVSARVEADIEASTSDPRAADVGGLASAPVVAGVVPIENLVNGTVRENYDLLLEFPLEIRGEVVVPVHLCLAALPGETLDSIERVYSHIQALGQADEYLRGRPWILLTTYNTAGAGKAIVERGERGAAAVLSPRAAALFGLEVLADGIQSVPDNRTRFLVLAAPGAVLPPPQPAAVDPSGAARTTLVMGIRNEPGALLRALAVFAAHDLNMSKLESRPARDRPWEYVFWVDLDADASAPGTQAALADLAGVTTSLRLLGSYPRGAGA